MDWKEIMHKAGDTLKTGTIDFIEQQCAEEIAYAEVNQKKNDIIAAIKGYIDLKASDMTILELLQKYFGIDSISEGKRYITDARTYYQCNKLKEYLGLNNIAWGRYKCNYEVMEKLRSNPKLLEMPPDKLKTAVEK